MNKIDALLKSTLLPVVSAHSVKHALYIAEGLLAANVPQIEITLRTPCAIEAISEVARQFPSIRIWAGSVLNTAHMHHALAAGAIGCVSPGITPELALEALRLNQPWIPGTSTASDWMHALEYGFELVKLFPAQALGGPAYAQQLLGPMPNMRIIPTGGIGPEHIQAWQALPAVVSVGGSWLTQGLPMVADASIVHTVTRRVDALNGQSYQ